MCWVYCVARINKEVFIVKKKILSCLCSASIFLFMLVFAPVSVFAAQKMLAHSVLGEWQTVDAKTNKPTSIITLSRHGGVVIGRITKIYAINGAKNTDICTACRGEQHNKRILGLRIISKMKCSEGYCYGGRILDPRDGKIYKAKMHVTPDGQLLKVRGYIGISLFGKTVVWQRPGYKPSH